MLAEYSGVGALLSAVTVAVATSIAPFLALAAFASCSGRFRFLPRGVLLSLPATAVAAGAAAVGVAGLRLHRSGVSLLRGKVSAVIVGISRREKPARGPAESPSLINRACFLQQLNS